MGKFFLCNLSMRKSLVMTSRMSARIDCRGGDGQARQPLGVFGQFSLAGNRVAALHWQPGVFWREIILVTSNGINEQETAREKRRLNLRNLRTVPNNERKQLLLS